MTIDKHKWSDEMAEISAKSQASTLRPKSIRIQTSAPWFLIDENDAVVIAKHFNQDRESLVLKIKELAKAVSNPNAEVFSVNDLIELTKES